MLKSERHVSQGKRAFLGEQEAGALVDWLNSAATVPGKARVIAIIESIHFLSAPENQRLNYSDTQDEVLALYEKLSRYSYNPFFLAIQPGKIRVEWMPRNRMKYVRTSKKVGLTKLLSGTAGVAATVLDREVGYDEDDAVFHLTRLAEQGLISRLKRCRCDRWIYARFSHQEHCSARCRVQHYRSSEEWKQHRRAWSRRNYELNKQRNAYALQRVKQLKRTGR